MKLIFGEIFSNFVLISEILDSNAKFSTRSVAGGFGMSKFEKNFQGKRKESYIQKS